MFDRFGLSVRCVISVVGVLFACALSAHASPIHVGDGDDHVTALIQFSDGALYEFDVAFTDDNAFTGLNVFDVIEDAGIGFSTVRIFGGEYIDGITYDGRTDSGYGGGEDWWHYWYMEPADTDWTAAAVGANDRIMHDGYTEGWVYGDATPPGAALPEPATAALFILSATLLLYRRPQTAKGA